MIVCDLSRIARFRGLGPSLDEAIAWLNSGAWKSLPDGRHSIRGDLVFATISSYRTRPPEELRWETHGLYVDFQMLLEGGEYVLVRDSDGFDPEEPYDEEKDIAFWRQPVGKVLAGTQRLALEAGLVALFFPEDAHAPCGAIDAPASVRKLVVKARVRAR